jgi:hypothetical protein
MTPKRETAGRSSVSNRVVCPAELDDTVSLEYSLEGVAVKVLIFGDHVDDACHVGKQVSLVFVCQDRGHRGRVKFDILIMDFDKVNLRVLRHKRP